MASSSASVTLRRASNPRRSMASICHMMRLASKVTRLSLLTDAEMNRNWGLKATRPAPSRARRAALSPVSRANSRAASQTAATLPQASSKLKTRAA